MKYIVLIFTLLLGCQNTQIENFVVWGDYINIENDLCLLSLYEDGTYNENSCNMGEMNFEGEEGELLHGSFYTHATQGTWSISGNQLELTVLKSDFAHLEAEWKSYQRIYKIKHTDKKEIILLGSDNTELYKKKPN